MRYIPRAGTDPSFMIKAMSEASGELRELMWGLRRATLLQEAPAPDDGWTLMGIAYHLNHVEKAVAEQVQMILSLRDPEVPHAPLEDIPFPGDYDGCDEDELLGDFYFQRRRNAYLLWDISLDEWERAGIHPYRGRCTLREIIRELYQHDLEHLWQARRIVEGLAAGHGV